MPDGEGYPVRCALHEEQLTNLLRGFERHDRFINELREAKAAEDEARKEILREVITARNASSRAAASAEKAANSGLESLQETRGLRDNIRAEVSKISTKALLLATVVDDLSDRVESLEGGKAGTEEVDEVPRSVMPSIVEHEHWSDQTKSDLRRMDPDWLLHKADVEREARLKAEKEVEEERLARVKAETALSERERHSDRVHMADEMVFKKRKLVASVLIAAIPVLLTLIAAIAKVVEIVEHLFR